MLPKLRNIFGSTQHGPRSVFRKCDKHHKNGRDINFLNPSECRVAAKCLQNLRVYCLKDAVQMATRDRVFISYKRFQFMTKPVNSEELRDTLFALIQECYQIYRILHLTVMRVGEIDKICYFVRQADRLLKQSMENAMECWHHPLMPMMEFIKCNLGNL